MDVAYVAEYVAARTGATVEHSLARIETSRRHIAATRRRRWRTVRGGSTTDTGFEHRRERVRRFVNREQIPRIQAGYAVTPKRCEACGRSILLGESEYDIGFVALTFVLDRDCFAIWQDEMTRPKNPAL